MSLIVKVCSKHGELTIDQVYEEKYSTGKIYRKCKQCKKGHIRNYYEANKQEKITKIGAWKRANRETVNRQARELRAKNPEFYKERERNYYKKYRISLLIQNKLRRFNLTLDEYNALFNAHKNKCAICGEEETRRHVPRKGSQIQETRTQPLCIDHCHATGKIRGLLCHSCNTGIGKFFENEELIMKALEYLKKHKE